MKLISTTIAGPGTDTIIGDALRSVVGLVDTFLTIWTGPEDAAESSAVTCERERVAIELLDQETHGRHWPWRNDFAVARNAALEFASSVELVDDWNPVVWMLMIDTDERVICPDPAAVRAFLVALPTEVEVVVAHAADGSHSRERFFRLPAKHRWIGRTHEAFPVERGQQATIPASLIAWTELPKTPEQLRAKNERDVLLLSAEVEEHPDDPRWRFYLGAALAGCGRHEEAIETYRAAADRGRGEDCALACARAAEILISDKRYEEAVAACARGMTIRPEIAELPWLAAGACINAGDHFAAEAWARIAEVHGERGAGRDALERRVSFRNPRALREGPAEIMALARRALGKAKQIHITVTSTGLRAGDCASMCVRSVREQRAQNWGHVYVAGDRETYRGAWGESWSERGRGKDCRIDVRQVLATDGDYLAPFPSLLENLLPVWRSLPDDEVIVWLDGDDWLATDRALETVAVAHKAGALATYGSFMFEDGRPAFFGQCGPDPRSEPWRASHLKTFRAGLVKQIRDEDLRRPDGAYVDLAIDQAIMIPIVEMAAERAVYIPQILCVYNSAHSFGANAAPEELDRERAEVARIRSLPRYPKLAGPLPPTHSPRG